jgi:hypothetical protein
MSGAGERRPLRIAAGGNARNRRARGGEVASGRAGYPLARTPACGLAERRCNQKHSWTSRPGAKLTLFSTVPALRKSSACRDRKGLFLGLGHYGGH